MENIVVYNININKGYFEKNNEVLTELIVKPYAKLNDTEAIFIHENNLVKFEVTDTKSKLLLKNIIKDIKDYEVCIFDFIPQLNGEFMLRVSIE